MKLIGKIYQTNKIFMVDNDKKEWQKKIPEFTTKFVHDDALEVGIEIYGPKNLVEVYESYFHTVSAALLIAFPELTEVIRLEKSK